MSKKSKLNETKLTLSKKGKWRRTWLLNRFEYYYKKGKTKPDLVSEYAYSRINDLHKNYKLKILLKKDFFYDYLYLTLALWGMDRGGSNDRGPKLETFQKFKKSIQSCEKELLVLEPFCLEGITDEQTKLVQRTLRVIFKKLHLMKSKPTLVANSKLLHFILPKLVVPIDRTYTLTFFDIYANKLNCKNVNLFIALFDEFKRVCSELELKTVKSKKLFDGCTPSVAKLIDNAIIGLIGFKPKR